MKLNIDTEIKSGGGDPMPVSGPGGPYYPEFTFNYDEEDAVPDQGTMTIRYKVSRKSEDAKRPKDRRYSCTIEVVEIVSAQGEKDRSPSKKYNDAGDALDALAKEKYEEKE